jgi:nucleotidyltransferase substrate binding protein (TIGR01987 family)
VALEPLDITPLINATGRLRDRLERHRLDGTDEQLRDGLIQRFEYTYELCQRMLKRFIRKRSASPGQVDRMAFQGLIRTANRQGSLAGDWPAWHRYRDLRAQTSHTYRAEPAQLVADAIHFWPAEYLRDQLKSRLA